MRLRLGSSHLSLLLLSGTFFLNFSSRILLSPLLPRLEKDLHLSHGQAGLFFFIISCGYFISLSGASIISARIGHKLTIITSLIGISCSLVLLSCISTLPSLRLALFLLGLSAGLYLPSAITTISSLFQPQEWGRAFGVHEVAPNLAFLTAPLYIAILLPVLSWQNAVQLLAVITSAAAVLYAFLGSSIKNKPGPLSPGIYRSLAGNRKIWLMILLFSMGITGTMGIYSVLPTFLVSEHGLSEQAANLLTGSSRLPALFTALVGGVIADRFGSRKTICLVLICTGCATILLGQGRELLKFYIFLQPVLAVCFFPAAFALLANIGSVENRSLIVSFTIPLSFVIGGGIIPAVITRMADHGNFSLAIILTGCLISCSSLLVGHVQENSL